MHTQPRHGVPIMNRTTSPSGRAKRVSATLAALGAAARRLMVDVRPTLSDSEAHTFRQQGTLRASKRLVAVLGPLLIVATLTGNGTAYAANASTRPSTAPTKAEWQRAIAHVPNSGRGCFRASYPALAWHAVQCTIAPKWPLVPGSPVRSSSQTAPMTVGNGNDYTTEVAGTISGATGYFSDVSPGITETGQTNGSGPQVAEHLLASAEHAVLCQSARLLRSE